MRLMPATNELIGRIPGMIARLDRIASGDFSTGDVIGAVNAANKLAALYTHVATGAAQHQAAYGAIMAMHPDVDPDFATSFGQVQPLFTAWLDKVQWAVDTGLLDLKRTMAFEVVGTVPDGQGGTVDVQARHITNADFDAATVQITGLELNALRNALAALVPI